MFAGVRPESTTRANRLCRHSSKHRPAFRLSPSTRSKLEVQIFGIKKSADTRKALRFFAERRVKTHFVDLMERPAALGVVGGESARLTDEELTRIAELVAKARKEGKR